MADFDKVTPATTALANNKLGPAGSYKFRKYWKEDALSEGLFDSPLIDFWYGKLFHGWIDGDGTVVYPSETNLKQLPTGDGKTLFVLDFVADAFSDFKLHMRQARARGAVIGEGAIVQMSPKRGWVSIHRTFGAYMEVLYDHLVSFWFQKEQRNSKVKDFSGFLREFMELVNDGARTLLFTQSAFILSRHFSPLSSGLIIEISDAPHSTDSAKAPWIKDPNFAFYRSAARNFGLLVDKNAPWRLVADINNPRMAKYMEPYGVTGGDLFETYYYKCHLYDIEVLKRYLVEMYNAYVIAFPEAKELRIKLKGGSPKTVSRLIARRPTTLDDVNRQFGPEFWLKTYYYIRLREMGAPRNPVEFNKTLEKILHRHKLVDIEHALGYIDNKIRRLKVP